MDAKTTQVEQGSGKVAFGFICIYLHTAWIFTYLHTVLGWFQTAQQAE